MATEFTASEPTGRSNKPDSPVVPGNASITTQADAESVSCTYQGSTYGKGARICMGGKVHECGKDGWVNLGTKC